MTRKEFVHFFLKNKKVIFAICVYAGLIFLALVGPYLTPYKDPLAFVGPGYQPPSKEHWLGTNTFGQDIFTQLVYGLRSSLFVGLLGGTLATVIGLLIGFVAGYRGGWFDELLMMFTNILMVIPTLALLIIIAAYLPYRGVFIESVIIGFTAWPWTARAVRAQTLSLKTREFVDLARITARSSMKIIFGEIMPNMMSYVFMVFILQFGGAILAATGLDFIGLGPTRGISLGIMMQQATLWNAIQLGMWWWAVTPGAVITLMVATLYVMNAGLDEVFNPKLRGDVIGVAEVVLNVKDLKIYYRTLYGYVKAVDGVSFDIKRGEILGIAGESGCGKSTLGNGLILLKPPMKYMGGEAILDGKNIMTLSPRELRKIRYEKISIIPQYAMDAMNPTKKIKQIIDDLLHEHGESFERKRDLIEERLEIVNLGKKVLNMYPIELSGGMKQRMVMVISTLMNPDVLIADEITSALDVSSQRSVIQMLYEMRERKIMGSLAFITHDLSVLYQIADKVMVLYAGRVAEISPMENIVKEPLHPYTKMLLSSLPKIGVRYSQTKLKGIPGYPPSLLNIGPGCRFRDRCPYAFEKCEQDPPVFDVDGRKVSCWLFERGDAN